MDFASLPPGPGVPALDEIAAAIARGVPASERGDAHLLLLASILPWDLRGLASFAEPRRLVEIAYRQLVESLASVPPAERLSELQAQSKRRESQRLLDDAVAAAVACWAAAHAPVVLPAPWNVAAERFRELDADGLAGEVARQRGVILALEAGCDDRARRLTRPHLHLARFTLNAADRRSFDVAAGPLLVFLRDMGVDARDMTFELQRPRTDRMAQLKRAVAVPPARAKRRSEG